MQNSSKFPPPLTPAEYEVEVNRDNLNRRIARLVTACIPPDLNEGSKVAPSGFSDPGVCIQSKNPLGSLNRDSTGLRYVRKGCVVQFPGGATCRVARVRTGLFWADIPIPSRMPSHLCSCVTVLHG